MGAWAGKKRPTRGTTATIRANADSLREAEHRVRLLQLVQVRGPELFRPEIDHHSLDGAGEAERGLVQVTHRRAGVLAGVKRFVRREPAEDRLLNAALRRLLV